MENLKLSAPWITFWHEVEALFREDDEVTVKFDSNENVLKLFVDNDRKAEALEQLIPEKKVFGNVTVKIEIIPSNRALTKEELFMEAFEGNPALSYTESVDNPLGELRYIVFQNKVVQFFNDQLDDINGNKSMLFEDIAKDVFGEDHGVFYCTDTKEEYPMTKVYTYEEHPETKVYTYPSTN